MRINLGEKTSLIPLFFFFLLYCFDTDFSWSSLVLQNWHLGILNLADFTDNSIVWLISYYVPWTVPVSIYCNIECYTFFSRSLKIYILTFSLILFYFISKFNILHTSSLKFTRLPLLNPINRGLSNKIESAPQLI